MVPSSKHPAHIVKELLDVLTAAKNPELCPECGSPFEFVQASFASLGADEESRNVSLPVCPRCDMQRVLELPEYVAISPISLTCPRCKAEPEEVCEVIAEEGLEIVHVERIKLAAALDVSAKERFDRLRIASKPSE